MSILETPTLIRNPELLRQSWNEAFGGSRNAGKVAVLEQGTTFKAISHSPQDSQLLETCKFSVEEICRIFRVPPHMVQNLERATFNNIEQMSLDCRTLFVFSDTDSESTEEAAVDRISEELDELEKKRNALLIRKGDLGIQEANLHTLLKLVDRILMREGSPALLKTGTDDVAAEAVRDPACYDLADFYDRTDEISQWGPVTEYDDDLVRRFVEKVTVLEDGLEVKSKAGISVMVKK